MAMHIAKTSIAYHRFFVTRSWWLTGVGLVPLTAFALMPHGSVAGRVCVGLFALSVAITFALFGVDIALFGLSLFYRRYQQSLASAIFGIALCSLGAAFSIFSGVAAFLLTFR
jgi:hypothetical protein